MTLEDLGFTEQLKTYRIEQCLDSFEVGRVVLEHKDRYIVKTAIDEYDAELIGSLRYSASSRHDFPAVGDWVAFSEYDEGKALIHSVYPRSSIISRQAVGTSGQEQIIATNVDVGLIVQAVNRDFNLNRLERYLTICNASKIEPIIVLSKTDLLEKSELDDILVKVHQRLKEVPVITINHHEDGFQEVKEMIKSGCTYCLLGSSGVGKSTLLNNLSGNSIMKTGEISSSVNKGKHVTTHRELVVLPGAGILIDNPGMREIGITDSEIGLSSTFESIIEYSEGCRFKDCTHVHEAGCAILQAVENGDIDEESYANFSKMQKERAFFESTKLERKKKDKEFGKIIKGVKEFRKNNKY